jgi:hypothetical protein
MLAHAAHLLLTRAMQRLHLMEQRLLQFSLSDSFVSSRFCLSHLFQVTRGVLRKYGFAVSKCESYRPHCKEWQVPVNAFYE